MQAEQQGPIGAKWPLPRASALAPLASLAACGGGESAPGHQPAGTNRPLAETPVGDAPGPEQLPSSNADAGLVTKTGDPAAAAAFLMQAGFAAPRAEIEKVLRIGFDGWLDEQFRLRSTQSRWDYLADQGFTAAERRNTGPNPLHMASWRKLIGSPDALRQRLTLALSEILVVSISGIGGSYRALRVAHHADLLEAHAFGTYRNLLGAVTRTPAMGQFLSMRGSKKENPATGRRPDENYAREIMQLFTIGLVRLAPDGTALRERTGAIEETYTQDDVTELARVFTGWDNDGNTGNDPLASRRPMRVRLQDHATGPKRFLGAVVEDPDPERELDAALDVLCSHPNNGPFLGRQLIQRLVKSNPSPAYVSRVTAVWNADGLGRRGHLASVVRAILLDPEARTADTNPLGGRLSEPMVRLAQWGRTFRAVSPDDGWQVGDTSDPSTALGQAPFAAPSVFNFYRPGYVPPNTELARADRVAPEFQIVNESSVVGYVNFMAARVERGFGGTAADPSVTATYADEMPLADDPVALVAHLSLVLTAGRLPSSQAAQVVAAIQPMPADDAAERRRRIAAAVLLVMITPAYLVRR